MHHYLDTSLNKAARCFVAFWDSTPVAFASALHFPHPKVKNVKREHRTVCLPDYQGVGIGNALSAYVGSVCRGNGWRFMSQTSHPAMIRYRNKSNDWKMTRKPARMSVRHSATSLVRLKAHGNWQVQTKRITASFEYVGKCLDKDEAYGVWNGRFRH